MPRNLPGPARSENRRILSSIMHMPRSGCQWCDCPPEYGLAKTVYIRFRRWSDRGYWQKLLEAVTAAAEVPERVALDSTHVKVHCRAGGGTGGPDVRRLALQRAGINELMGALPFFPD